jgi:glutathione S-transferase
LQLTIADWLVEAHDTHHPIGGAFYYEDQKPESARRAAHFTGSRLPKFLGYFERVLELNDSRRPWMIGARPSYADLSMAQVIAGLKYAFPSACGRALRRRPRLRALHDAVFDRPLIARYVASGRRVDFNNDDLFRHYPELDR